MSYLFSGQGSVYAANVVAGVPGAFRHVGTVPQFDVSFESDIIEHKESTSGQRLVDSRLLRGNSARVSIQLDEMTEPKNLADGLLGLDSTITGSSVTDEAQPTLAVGEYFRTIFPDISAVTVKDSAGSPATLVLDTDYEITSAAHGRIKMLDLGAYTQPFTIDYTYASSINVKMLSETIVERWIMLDGINTVPSATHPNVRVDLYKVALDPTEVINLISDEYGNFVLNGNALYDATKVGDATLGQFGRVILL